MSKKDFESSQNLVRTFFKTRCSRAISETLFWPDTFCKIKTVLKKKYYKKIASKSKNINKVVINQSCQKRT